MLGELINNLLEMGLISTFVVQLQSLEIVAREKAQSIPIIVNCTPKNYLQM
jgi:hypothetical protein